MKARELETAGFEVKFERFVGTHAGHERWLDIAVFKNSKMIMGYQGVKQVNLVGPTVVNPRETGLADEISKALGIPVQELVTGIRMADP